MGPPLRRHALINKGNAHPKIQAVWRTSRLSPKICSNVMISLPIRQENKEAIVKVGINLINFGAGCDPDMLARWAAFAEETGFHLLMISDHVALTPDVQAGFPAPFYDPFISLAWLAAHTTTIELGTTVTILPYRHPLLTARMVTNIDRLSGGRFILGVGVGWAKKEFEALAVPFESRGAISNKYLEVIRRCWTEEVVSYEGRFVRFKRVHSGPPPVKRAGERGRAGIPIWVGGSSAAALRRAVRFGDAWHPYRFSLKWLQTFALPELKKIAEGEGRRTPDFCPRLSLQVTETPVPAARRQAGQGTIEQVREDLRALEALGATHVLLDTYAGPEQALKETADRQILARLVNEALDLAEERVREAWAV